ncbi:MAG: hypothetical protein ABI151_04465 [Chitinophagaceae bacterium]
MKTSNIILLGLVITIFTVPLLVIASLNSKIKNKEFILVKNNDATEKPIIREGTLQPFHVVKLVAPNADYLECHVKAADTASFNYQKYGKEDSIAVYTSNDTLYVNYISPGDASGKKIKIGSSEQIVGNRLQIELKIKSLSTLIVDGASVLLDSMNTNEGFKLILKNNGRIRDVRVEKNNDSSSNEIQKEKIKTQVLAQLEPQKESIEALENHRSPLNVEIKDMLVFRLM